MWGAACGRRLRAWSADCRRQRSSSEGAPMQSKHFAAAPASLTRFMTGTVAALALAVSLLANVALGGVALHTSGHLPSFGDSQPRHAALQATYVETQGEGLLGPALPAAAPRALPNTNPYAG